MNVLPDGVWSPFTVRPRQTFDRISRPQAGFLQDPAAAIIVLLVLLLTMNAIAIRLRDRYQTQRTA